MIERTAGIVHDAKIPYSASDKANAASSTIFATAKIVFSIGTQTVCRRPVSTPSCRANKLHPIVATTNQRATRGSEAKPCSWGAHSPRPARKTNAAKPDRTTTSRYAAPTSRDVERPAVGMKRLRAPARLS